MYKCRVCGSVCNFLPMSDKDGKLVFVCSNKKCNHYFSKSLFDVVFGNDKVYVDGDGSFKFVSGDVVNLKKQDG